MSYFLSPQNLFPNLELEIDGEEAAHILFSRRVKVGAIVEFQGPDGHRFKTSIIDAKKRSVIVKVLEETDVPEELKIPITLFQAFISEKALDFIFQKGTELGLNSIVLFNAQNTPSKLTNEIFQAKSARWEKILWEAAKQSGRGTIPKVSFVEKFDNVITKINELGSFFMLDQSAQESLVIKKALSCGYIVGPEGGFSGEELKSFKTHLHIQQLKISPFTLRAETAALAGLVLLNAS